MLSDGRPRPSLKLVPTPPLSTTITSSRDFRAVWKQSIRLARVLPTAATDVGVRRTGRAPLSVQRFSVALLRQGRLSEFHGPCMVNALGRSRRRYESPGFCRWHSVQRAYGPQPFEEQAVTRSIRHEWHTNYSWPAQLDQPPPSEHSLLRHRDPGITPIRIHVSTACIITQSKVQDNDYSAGRLYSDLELGDNATGTNNPHPKEQETDMRMAVGTMTLVLSAAVGTFAAPPELAFRSVGDGLFAFNTGKLEGRLKLDGKYQGLYPLVDCATGEDLTNPPGVFSFYRLFSSSKRYGKAARDWPTRTSLLTDGAVEVHWAAAKEHPVEIKAVYRWTTPDTLDVNIAVLPEQPMPGFELFVSSYFTKGFRASVYRNIPNAPRPVFDPVDRASESTSGYVMFPRDGPSLQLIQDGRWAIPPNPVQWDIRKWLAAPVAIRCDAKLGLTALMMTPPKDCFAVSTPWNPAFPDRPGYRSLYLSLFGTDLPASQWAHAHCRLIIRRDLSTDEVVRCYKQYVGAK